MGEQISALVFFLLACGVIAGTVLAFKPGQSAGGTITLSGFNGQSVLIGFAFVVVCANVLGLPFGLPVVLAVLTRELGKVLAHQMLGHEITRFRLVPWPTGQRISDKPLNSDGEEFLISIMGPALCLGPMALAAALAVALQGPAPTVSNALWIFAATMGAANFVLLLPFAPFDGEKCMRCAVASYWPALAPAMAVFMSTAMFTASLRTGSIFLMLAALFGAQSLLRCAGNGRAPLKPDHGLIALAAYIFTMAAHFSAGWWLFEAYFN